MKKILSLVLAIAMLVGLLPSFSIAGAAELQTLTYMFDVNAIADASIISSNSVQANLVTDASKFKSDVNGIWTFYANVGFRTAALYKGGAQMRVDPANIKANGLVLKTSFEKAASYETTILFNKSTANGRTNV